MRRTLFDYLEKLKLGVGQGPYLYSLQQGRRNLLIYVFDTSAIGYGQIREQQVITRYEILSLHGCLRCVTMSVWNRIYSQ